MSSNLIFPSLKMGKIGSLFFVLFGAIVSIIFWYELFRVWSMRPF